MQIQTYRCPNCDAPVSLNDTACDYCSAKLYFNRMEDVISAQSLPKFEMFFHKGEVEQNPDASFSLALCHLHKGQYQHAMKHFEKAIEYLYPDSDVYFYQCLTLLQGKRPRLHTLRIINRIVQYLEIAINQNMKGKYFYLYGVVVEDYYEGKHLRVPYHSSDLYQKAESFCCSEKDKAEILKCINYVKG